MEVRVEDQGKSVAKGVGASGAEPGISVTVMKQAQADGLEVIFANVSSNHYTEANFTADTCCSCGT